MDHPFDLPDDFDFAQLGRDYETGQYTIDELCQKWDLSRDTFLAIRKAAPKTWTKRGPNYWWSELDEDVDELAEKAADRAKAAKAEKKARQKEAREDAKAARQWYELESALDEAAERFREEEYEAPKPSLTISSEPPEEGAILLQGQDWHVGKRPAEAKEGYMNDYIDALKQSFADSMETAMRLRHIEKLYLVTGGDLIHVDGPHGTTNQTPQDLLVNPSEAFKEAIELLVWCIDYARSLGIEVHVLTVMGNHDRTLSSAAGVAVQQRFHSAEDVVPYPLKERVYTSYGDSLILATHGDMKKRQWKKLPSIMMSEARDLLATTENQIVTSGHLHFQSMDLEDKAGTLFSQASSPSPADEWHYREGYSTSRRAMEMLVLEPEGPSTSIIQEPVTV